MTNLIWKDLIVQKRLLPLYVGIMGFYFFSDFSSIAVSDISPFAWLAFIMSTTLIMNAFYYDEKDNINILLNSLPYTRRQIVSSKYIGALLFTALFLVLTIVGSFIVNGMELAVSWKEVLQTFGLVMAWLTIMFPFFYKFKQQYLLLGAVIFLIVGITAFNILFHLFNARFGKFMEWLAGLTDLQFYSALGLGIVLLYGASWRLSIRIYERKVF